MALQTEVLRIVVLHGEPERSKLKKTHSHTLSWPPYCIEMFLQKSQPQRKW